MNNKNVNIIEDIRVADFLMSLSKNDDNKTKFDEWLYALKVSAYNDGVPIIRDETKDFIKMLLLLVKPKKILELGTAVAYSTVIMAGNDKDVDIVTVENYEKRIVEAKKNIKHFDEVFDGDKNRIHLMEMDVTEYLNNNKGKEEFDFVFLDAAKGQYINWFWDIKRLMKKNAILLSDNVFQDGDILESRFLIRKRDRTIHKRMREFLYQIKNDNGLETYIFNIADGMAISIKK